MKTSETIEQDLAQLGEELGTQPDLARRVLDEYRSRATSRITPESARRVWFPRRSLMVAAAMGLVLLLAGWWLAAPTTLYGRVQAALARAKTVHVTGWTLHLVRKWPLENPPRNAPDADVRHPIDAWFWSDTKGQPASYEKFGPVVGIRRGGSFREYQEDAQLLFVSDGNRSKDYVDRISSLAEHLQALQGPDIAKKDLGSQTDADRTLKGWRVTRNDRIEEFWLDAKTDLPARLSTWSKQRDGKAQVSEMTFAYNMPVPEEIVRFEPPATKNMRYGGANVNTELAWRQQVQEIGRLLQNKPIPGRVALLPRDNGRSFEQQWWLQTPDGKYWVVPIDDGQYSRGMSLSNFIHNRAGTATGDRRHGTWRVPRELRDLEIPRHDLVIQEGTPWQEWVSAVLDRFGLDSVDMVEERTVWIARHDGRKLKPWRSVKPPVSYVMKNGVEQKGFVAVGIGFKLVPVTMSELFDDFNLMIDSRDYTAKRPLIFDETGLPTPPPFDPERFKSAQEFRDNVVIGEYGAATDSPWFVGDEALVMARTWYQKEFGITMTEEVRPFTVHIVRRKVKAE